MVISIIIITTRYFIFRTKNISVEIYVNALRDENNGHFEEAVVAYEIALGEVKKIRFHRDLRNKIKEKIKVLHTLIEYQNGLRFIR